MGGLSFAFGNMPDARDPDFRPMPPERPAPDECCQSGCDPCVFDLYEDALDHYETALTAWEARRRTPPA
jgi:hypothetical protein